MRKQVTLVFLHTPDHVCLAMKKVGFGAGKWNGFGGKVEPGETIESCAIREVAEETGGVQVFPEELVQVAWIDFVYEDVTHECHVFFVSRWKGQPEETGEMRPQWFSRSNIPYSEMWEDDVHWLPRVLRGERLRGAVWFAKTGKKIERMEWHYIEKN